MKKIKLSFLLTVCMCMMGTKVSAQDLAVENSQGKTIYYSYAAMVVNWQLPATRTVLEGPILVM